MAFENIYNELVATDAGNVQGFFAMRNGRAFVQVNLPDAKFDEAARTGWKFHLSVDPKDVPKATGIVADICKKYRVDIFKVTLPEYSEKFNRPDEKQKGKMFTLYDFGNKHWPEIMQEIETRFTEAAVKPSQPIPGEYLIPGSQYSYRRNDYAPGYRSDYISAREVKELVARNPNIDPVNPFGHHDPLKGMRVVSNGLKQGPDVSSDSFSLNPAQLMSAVSDFAVRGKIERLSTNKGDGIIFRGRSEDIAKMHGALERQGIATALESPDSFAGGGLRVKSDSMQRFADVLRSSLSVPALMPQVASFAVRGQMKGVPTNKGEGVFFIGRSDELDALQRSLAKEGIKAVVEPSLDSSGEMLRVKSDSMQRFNDVVRPQSATGASVDVSAVRPGTKIAFRPDQGSRAPSCWGQRRRSYGQ